MCLSFKDQCGDDYILGPWLVNLIVDLWLGCDAPHDLLADATVNTDLYSAGVQYLPRYY